MKVRREGKYPTPKKYENFQKQMLQLLKGLNVVRNERVRWVNSGIVYRMDLDLSPKHNGKVTMKGSVIATENAFYLLTVDGDLRYSKDFFSSFTPLSTITQ